VKSRLPARRADEGYTLVELLVTSAMGVVVMGAVVALLISALRDQPKITGQAQNVTTARWVLDRMTHEIRNGVVLKRATGSEVSFEGYVRHSTCGGSALLPSGSASIKCEITFSCSTTGCSRAESQPGTFTGTPVRIFDGIDSSEVFSYECPGSTSGCASPTEATYVKATLRLPDPDGRGGLTVSDGASMRNATLGL
jgi:type II secretory pathway pseudopilin PulG